MMSVDHKDGFILPEALVALAILSLILAAWLNALSSSLGGWSMAREREKALVVAKNQLALAMTSLKPTLDQQSGVDASGLQWNLSLRPYHQKPGLGITDLVEVTVEVSRPHLTQFSGTIVKLQTFAPVIPTEQ